VTGMYNRYHGNTGRVERVDDGERRAQRPAQPARGAPFPPREQPGKRGSILDVLDGILPKKLDGFETEDLLLLLILYLMYKDSGDKEMLIIMGAMFLL
jgi:hypothetical protein